MEKQLVQYLEPEATLCIYEDKSLVKSHVLAYHVIYSPSIHKRVEYFVDAHTGNVLSSINTVCFVDGPKTTTANDLNGVSRTVNTYQVGANYYMLDASRAMFNAGTSVLPDEPIGGILTVDMNNTFGDDASILHVATSQQRLEYTPIMQRQYPRISTQVRRTSIFLPNTIAIPSMEKVELCCR